MAAHESATSNGACPLSTVGKVGIGLAVNNLTKLCLFGAGSIIIVKLHVISINFHKAVNQFMT